MAQETIRLNCIESVYLGENKPDGNYGKTEELKLEHMNTSREHLKYFSILQFDVPDKIKKHKILSCKLNFNATIYATEDSLVGTRTTIFNFFSLKPEYQSIMADIYSAKYQDIASPSGTANVIKVGQKTNYGWDELRLTKNYPTYTDFALNYLGMDGYEDLYSASDFWNGFIRFLDNGIAFVLAQCDTTLIGQYTQVNIQSSRTATPPYMEVVVDTDYLYLETTSTGFVDPSRDFTFEWRIAPTLHLYDPMTQQVSAQFRIRKKGEKSITAADITGDNSTYTILANTLDAENYEWQVYVLTDAGRSATTEWKEFTTKDGTSSAEIISPNLVTVDGSAENKFEWKHIISTSSLPRGYEIQYREGDSDWQELVQNQNTTNEFYIAPPNTLPAGNIEWRVRTYNSNSIAGSWSNAASIIVSSEPAIHIITSISTSPRPVIKWQSEGQIQVEIKIGDQIKSLIYTDKEYKWDEFLQDGQVTVYIRVKNQFGLWSAWASASITIKNNPLYDIAISAEQNSFGINLIINSNYTSNYIYRNNELVGLATPKEGEPQIYLYSDYTAIGTQEYQVMGVDAQDNYKRSNVVTQTVSLTYGVLGDAAKPEWIELKKRRGSYPTHTIKTNRPITMVYYAGKSLPVAHVSPNLEREHALEFTTDKQTADRLETMTGKKVIYKDVRGDLIQGVLASVDSSRDRATDVKITITETQKEVVKIE